jgi:hypothetical protein
MAQYLVLIYEDESGLAAASPDDLQKLFGAHQRFGETNAKAIVGGNALEPTATATSIRRTDTGDDLVVTDGPFAETKEALGGYYLIEAPDLDAAIAVAKQVPAPYGGVEVRPIHVFE